MVKVINQKLRALVLWEAGHQTPESMLRRGKIPKRSAERYIASIRKHWRRVNEEFLAPYFNSMPERMEMVIENEGEKINY